MNLRETRVRETSALLVGPPRRRGVGVAGIGREIEDIAVTAGGHDHTIGGMAGDFTRDEITHDDALGLSIDEHELEHFGVVVHFHRPGPDHFGESGISTQ